MELALACILSAGVLFALTTVLVIAKYPDPKDCPDTVFKFLFLSPLIGALVGGGIYYVETPNSPDDQIVAEIIAHTEDYKVEISGIYLEMSQNNVVVFPSAVRRKSIKAWKDKENAKETAKEDAAKEIRNELKLQMINQIGNNDVQ